ncbi:hypothetical protein M1P56_24005 [Streptomyces sp. HU2014]|uniref:hypothetical protein n=1 Tax=Streptomyces sp. HU2014 TaxID=2939414 RepID=UPI002010061F|nr:hypothetical protein [Streptomyces sp. HU2014]UQI47188.1 hypothetical protein M1P56_24005 [Streptomyces sp. HU2014]
MDQTVYYLTVVAFVALMAALGAYAIKRLSNRPRALAAVLLAITAVIGAFPPVIRALAPPPAAMGPVGPAPVPAGREAPGSRP